MTNALSDKKIVNQKLLIVIALNIVLALVSFLKDTLLASYLGTSSNADTLFATFFLPDAIGFNILGQTASLVLVPLFVALFAEQRRKEALGTAYLASAAFIAISTFVTIALLAGDKLPLIEIIRGGHHIDKGLSMFLIKLLLPMMYIVPIAYIGIAYLNAQNRFIPTITAPIIYNASILLIVVLCRIWNIPDSKGIVFITATISAAAFIMTAYLLIEAGACKHRPNVRSCILESLKNKSRLHKLRNQSLYLILIYTLYQSVLFMERYVANRVCPGGISALNYAYRLAQFPLWVFISALLVVLLPEFSRNIAADNSTALYDKLHNAWLVLLLFITPVAILLFTFRSEVLSLVFVRGAFGSESLTLTSQIIAGYSLSIIFQSLSYLILRIYLVQGKMGKALLAYLLSSAVNVAFDLATYKIFGLWAIGIGAILGWFINMLLLFLMGESGMKKKLIFQEPWTPFLIIGANLIAYPACMLVKVFVKPSTTVTRSPLELVLYLSACCLIYLAIYVFVLIRFQIIQKSIKY